EMSAVQEGDQKVALDKFDEALFGHIGFAVSNGLRSLVSGLFGAGILGVKAGHSSQMRPYYGQITRLSSALALSADVAMLVLGGSLKKREKISARLGDVLSQLYLASAALKQFEDHGAQADEAAFVHWSVQDALEKAQTALLNVYRNFPNRWIGATLRLIVFPWGGVFRRPSDRLDRAICEQLMQPGPARDRLTANCYIPDSEQDPIGAIEQALHAAMRAEPIDAKIRDAEKRGVFEGHPAGNVRDITELAHQLNQISDEEYALLRERDRLRDKVIHVDDFPFDLGLAKMQATTNASTSHTKES